MALRASNIAMWSIACPRAFAAFRSCFSTAMASALPFQSMTTSPRAAVADSARAPLIQIARENLDIGFIGISPFKGGPRSQGLFKCSHIRGHGRREEAVKL